MRKKLREEIEKMISRAISQHESSGNHLRTCVATSMMNKWGKTLVIGDSYTFDRYVLSEDEKEELRNE